MGRHAWQMKARSRNAEAAVFFFSASKHIGAVEGLAHSLELAHRRSDQVVDGTEVGFLNVGMWFNT